jgi:hypothetical protein
MWLAATGTRQEAELGELGLDAILIIDEPGIAAAGLRGTDAAVWDPLRASVPTWGVHICGVRDEPRLVSGRGGDHSRATVGAP